MNVSSRTRFRSLFLLVSVPLLGGCLAVAAGAGAAGAIAYTERGARSMVDAPVEIAAARTEAVFQELGIEMTEREMEDNGNEVTLRGKKGDMAVVVEIEDEGGETTEMEVYAREDMVEWDREYAKRVLERIVARS